MPVARLSIEPPVARRPLEPPIANERRQHVDDGSGLPVPDARVRTLGGDLDVGVNVGAEPADRKVTVTRLSGIVTSLFGGALALTG